MSRREAMSKLAGSSAALALMLNHSILVSANEPPDRVAHGSNSEMQPLRAFRGQHQPQPLRFDPAKLRAFRKLIRSSWENHYGGAVKALNIVEQRLATLAHR